MEALTIKLTQFVSLPLRWSGSKLSLLMRSLALAQKYRIDRQSLLRISIGFIYFWFGLLKFFPELGPAEALAKNTLSVLTMGVLPDTVAYAVLAVWEVTLGVFLVLGIFSRYTIAVALVHMVGTFMPFIIVSDATFNQSPLSLTLTGQYIMKNLVIASALVSLYPGKR